MYPTSPVLVVGAGISGLTAALAFAKRGFSVQLLERAGKLEEVGAGLQLSPNALRVLQRLDVLPAIRCHAVEADAVTLADFTSGRELARVPVKGRDGIGYLSILRAHLQAALAEAVAAEPLIDLRLGCEITALRSEGAKATLTVRRQDGVIENAQAEVLVAADGVRSSVGGLLGHVPAKPSGDVAWRMLVDQLAGSGIRAWLGAGIHAVAYPVDAGRRTNLVVVLPEARSDLQEATRRAEPELRRLVAAARDPSCWPLSTADRVRRTGDPQGLLLVGDAAHAMLPYAAQGAAMAIEDGYVAAWCLSAEKDPLAAWRRFETMRRERWSKVRKRVAFHRFVYHLPKPISRFRDLALALRTPARNAADLAWLYDWEPPES
ncbi:FAD-dependent monooxygenase [Aureimonas psammosilenae]|uniref:FAD-dependent monooxygenase n=1 Tax=Aureimonas psammosilenae TaxID=2495496 RepID=UPI0012607AC8|nr:FAD-dependent monooxygenase [Aureimonas psammosilenae]